MIDQFFKTFNLFEPSEFSLTYIPIDKRMAYTGYGRFVLRWNQITAYGNTAEECVIAALDIAARYAPGRDITEPDQLPATHEVAVKPSNSHKKEDNHG